MTTTDVVTMLFMSNPYAKDIPEETIAIYVAMLSDIPVAQLRDTVLQCIAESDYIPTVAKVRERWHDLTTDSLHGDAEEGWLSVKNAIRAVGYTRRPTFEDPLTSKTVDAMGWLELCASDNQVADRAHFIKMYNNFQERATSIKKLMPGARAMLEESAPAKMARMNEILLIATNGKGSER